MRTNRELANLILTIGKAGYKDIQDGLRISDKVTKMIEEHVTITRVDG